MQRTIVRALTEKGLAEWREQIAARSRARQAGTAAPRSKDISEIDSAIVFNGRMADDQVTCNHDIVVGQTVYHCIAVSYKRPQQMWVVQKSVS